MAVLVLSATEDPLNKRSGLIIIVLAQIVDKVRMLGSLTSSQLVRHVYRKDGL